MAPPRPIPGTFAYRAAVAGGKLNAWVIKRTGGRLGARVGGVQTCVLRHTGAKSQTERETALYYLEDGDDMILVASMGGSPKHPSWYHNLRAHPDTTIRRGRDEIQVRARVATPDERKRLWPRLLEMYGDYAVYQERTDREIPVVICAPR